MYLVTTQTCLSCWSLGNREKMECKPQGADGTVGWDVQEVNATCTDLGSQCQQYYGIRALSNCDMASYPYAINKINALNTVFT